MSRIFETGRMLQLLKILIRERKCTVQDLQRRLDVNASDFVSMIYFLDYLGVVEINNDVISMASQSFSLLFEPLLVYEGTEQFVEEIQNGTTRFTEDNVRIPAMLIPILLLRSLIPYFGLILRDIEKTEELGLNDEKKEFLYSFFSLFKFDYSLSIEKWSRMRFTSDEFYRLWFLVNKWLPIIIKTRSKYEIEATGEEQRKTESQKPRATKPVSEKQKSERTKEIANSRIDERFYNIPVENLRAFFRDRAESRPKIVYRETDYPIRNLTRLARLTVDTRKIVDRMKDYKQMQGEISIDVYKNNILKWSYSDEKGSVPSLFLTPGGICCDKQDLKLYSKQKIFRQSNYLQRLIERLGDVFGNANARF